MNDNRKMGCHSFPFQTKEVTLADKAAVTNICQSNPERALWDTTKHIKTYEPRIVTHNSARKSSRP
jgi:hypothetical protein